MIFARTDLRALGCIASVDRQPGYFAIAASKIKITETMMPNIEPFAKDRNKPATPIRTRTIRRGENWGY
jgi:hypothetical protein